MMMRLEMFKQYIYMEMDFSETNVELLLNDIQLGHSIKDTNMNMALNTGSITMNVSIHIINGKVNNTESITRLVGIFDYLALSYNKNRKLIGYSELTSYSLN